MLIAAENWILGENVWRSPDGGNTWSIAQTGMGNVHIWSLCTSGANVFAGGWEGVFLSTNQGENWTDISNGLSNLSVYYLCTNAETIFAGGSVTGGGTAIWRRPISEVTGVLRHQSDRIPSAYVLEANYPNPFNPSTQIHYEVPHDGNVHVAVYDLLGREVASLVDGFKPAGRYDVRFNANGIASGVYFYRLRAGSFVQTRKLVLAR